MLSGMHAAQSQIRPKTWRAIYSQSDASISVVANADFPKACRR